MPPVRIHLLIEGRVQGVWFRESTRREAQALGLTGWVRNCPDGRVEAMVEGPEDGVQQLVSWCWVGPPTARVRRVDVTPQAWQGVFDTFEIVF